MMMVRNCQWWFLKYWLILIFINECQSSDNCEMIMMVDGSDYDWE